MIRVGTRQRHSESFGLLEAIFHVRAVTMIVILRSDGRRCAERFRSPCVKSRLELPDPCLQVLGLGQKRKRQGHSFEVEAKIVLQPIRTGDHTHGLIIEDPAVAIGPLWFEHAMGNQICDPVTRDTTDAAELDKGQGLHQFGVDDVRGLGHGAYTPSFLRGLNAISRAMSS